MKRLIGFVLCVLLAMPAAYAGEPHHGGILRVYHRDSPGSPSILEESSDSVTAPFMAVFSNLVLYDQSEPRNTIDTIRPELATKWDWNADKTALTFQLREGVRWHDGKPFTAADVKCTWDYLLGRSKTPLRVNPRNGWYGNLKDVVSDGDYKVTFVLGRPQPSLLAMLASGYSAVYPCHVSPAEMRQHPIGTGPFKFVEYRRNERIVLTRNTDYWKPDRPFLDGIEWTIIPNPGTAVLAFVSGKVDMTFPNELTPRLEHDVIERDPTAICRLVPNNCAVNVLMNREKAPFDDPDIRRALALTLDRRAFVDILTDGKGVIGTAMEPGPEGNWGMPAEMMKDLPGYGPDVAASRAEARALMAKHGFGPDNHMKLTVSARNVARHRDAGVLLVAQLREIYIDAELETVDTPAWFPRIIRGDYVVGPNITCGAVDDPDQNFYENYTSSSTRNFPRFKDPAIEALFDRQSMETDPDKRRRMVWDIDHRLQTELARPILFHEKVATCWKPRVHGLTPMVNSVYNGPRFETVWMEE